MSSANPLPSHKTIEAMRVVLNPNMFLSLRNAILKSRACLKIVKMNTRSKDYLERDNNLLKEFDNERNHPYKPEKKKT